MKRLILAVLALGGVAQAEVKPDGTILATYCGHASRAHYVCIASAQGSKAPWITMTYVIDGDSEPTVYVPAKGRVVGGGKVLYEGRTVVRQGRYVIEKRYSLLVDKSGSQVKGTYSENGKKVGNTFRMDTIFHTQGL